MAKRKRTSAAWDSFELVDVTNTEEKRVKKAVCLLCNGLQLTYTGGTTNLLNHLQFKHPTVGESSSSAKQQLTLRSFQSKHCSPDRANDITRKIPEFIVRDLLRPIATVKGSGFKQLRNFMEPGYKVPSHSTYMCVTGIHVCRHMCMYSSMRGASGSHWHASHCINY